MATTLLEGANILNETLRNIGYDYQIDTTDNTTITDGLNKIGAFSPEQMNAVLAQMNLVIQTRNFAALFDAERNKFRDFIVDMNETGFGIEDVFHELIEGVKPQWDKNATGAEKADRMFSYDENKIHKTFHVTPDSNQVKTTIDMRNAHKLFTPYGVTSFIDVKLANLSYSMEVWLQKKIIETIKKVIDDQRCIFIEGMSLNTHQGVANACETIRSTTVGFETLNNLYNFGVYDEDLSEFRSVETISRSADDIYIVTTPENFERLKVQGYSNAFNLSQFELKNRVIYAPAGTDLGKSPTGEEVLFIAMDRKTIVIGIHFWRGSSVFIPTAFETNNFLTSEILKSYNTFFNCVAFSGEKVEPIEGEKKNNVDGQTTLTLLSVGRNLGLCVSVEFNGNPLLNDDFILQPINNENNFLFTYNKPLAGGNISFIVKGDTAPFEVFINGTPNEIPMLSEDTAYNYNISDGTIIGTSLIHSYY